MIYKFKSKAAGDVILLEPAGNQFLAIIGRTPAAKGIIEAGAIGAAVAAIEAAVAAEEAAPPADAARAETADQPDGPRSISLRQRMWPMVELLKRAAAEDEAVVWGV